MPDTVKDQQDPEIQIPWCQKICGKLLKQMGYYKDSF